MLPESAFDVRPVNTDNQRDLDMVVELLRRHQNSDAMARGISDFEFLSGQFSDLESDEQLMSMLLFYNSQPVAHIALRFEHNSRCPEIVLPAIDPEFRQYLMTFSNLFWAKIQHLASRQDWEMIYQLSPVSDAALQIVTSKQCDALEMAILPDPMHGALNGKRQPNQSLVLLVHLFQNRLHRPRYLYPPLAHAKKISELYGALDTHRIVVQSDSDEKGSLPPSLDVTGPLTRWRKLASIEELSIIPSSTTDIHAQVAQVEEIAARAETQKSAFWVRIALNDPGCDELCEILASRGFQFCGVFPVVNDRDWIIYSRFDRRALPVDSLRTPRGRALANYLSSAPKVARNQ